ncbi:unnamed protein product [Adineta steineri]|uniref:F-box domain-containing protein n=1 Tax=Adineta steineri TaxID=433720 RepID=A0A813UAX8_9BILA|nr:unnamed protein product [Adineta steineri]CAF0823748.1 unnamed protein product [Adineta steineri]CAF0864261.1 unnamed protein product [Adineta steineri]
MGQKFVTCFRPPPPIAAEQKLSEQMPPLSYVEQQDSTSGPLLCDMPVELLLYNISPYLTYMDLCHLSQVNRLFHNLLESTDHDNKELSAHLWAKCIKSEMLGTSTI